MPKENTHLWFAHRLLDDIRDQKMRAALSSHLGRYHLGSVIPDTFFYSGRDSLGRISEIIHGKDGYPTNILILSVLDQARGVEDLAFILGYITHCALDIVFHPMVDALSGDYYDEDPVEREKAVERHRSLETCIDIRIGNDLRIHRLVSPGLLRGLVFEEVVSRDFSVTVSSIESTLHRQILFNRLFASPLAYLLLSFLHRTGLVKSRTGLALFYPDAPDHGVCIPDPIAYKNPATGAEFVESLTALFARARTKALPMMGAAWGYADGSVSREQLLGFIPGENLSTGELPTRTSFV